MDEEKHMAADSKASESHHIPITDETPLEEGVDRTYQLKSQLGAGRKVNECLQNEIGWGRYQVSLFIVSGFGWAADEIWLQGLSLILPQITLEMNPPHIAFATLATYTGLIVGAATWGVLADIIGRRLSWNITLFLAGVFGIAAGGAKDFITLCSLLACLGFGVGGNLPVDGALYLEHIPQSHQWTLTLLSVWWAFGQLFASLVGWGFLANFSCPNTTVPGQCKAKDNRGWRYTMFTLGALTFSMFICRYFVFDLRESSKFLLAKGRDEEAIETLKFVASKNGKTITLTTDRLKEVSDGYTSAASVTKTQLLTKSFSRFSFSHVKPLFSTRRLAINTSLTIWLWGLIGLAYPLFNAFLPIYLTQHSVASGDNVNTTDRNNVIIKASAIPGSLVSCWLVGLTRKGIIPGGRKFALSISTAFTGIFLFLFTTAKTDSTTLAYSCISSFTQSAMYSVLYAYTPEVFPAPHRGTADALCSAFNRLTGLMAPIIATYGNVNSSVPVLVSASLFMAAAISALFLPIETAGKAAL